MLVSDKYKILFVHIPKTGGASIKQMIMNADSGAYVVGHYHKNLTREIAEQYQDYYKFAVVRNSYRSMASHYRFVVQGVRYAVRHWSFMKYLNHITVERDQPYPVQLDYISDEKGMLVDRVFMYDNGLEEELKEVKERLGFLGNLSRSKNEHYYGEYDWKKCFDDPKHLEAVRNACRKDIEYFGFEMPCV